MKTAKLLTSLHQTTEVLLVGGTLLFSAGASRSLAASGTWTNTTDSVWSATTNWLNGVVADGADNQADFSTVSGVSVLNVTLDSPRTLGNLQFGGITTLNLVGSDTLTLQTSTGGPTVAGTGQTLVFALPLASSQQVFFNGGSVALTNDANNLTGGVLIQQNPFGFTSQNALGSGTIQLGNAPGGNNGGSGQIGFTALSASSAGTAPVTVNNDFTIRTVRWIIDQAPIAGLNPQPLNINGHVTLDMGVNNVRDVFPFQPVTINGQLSGGQSGTSQFGLNLNGIAPLTLTYAGNDFVGGINFVAANTLGVNSAGALGYYQNRINFNTAGATLRIDAPFTIPSYQGNGIGLNVAANATIDCQTNDLEVDAVIQGNATLTKAGTGTLNLTAANTFSGPLALSAGTLQISGSGSVNTSAGITIPTNAVFLLTDSASAAGVSTVTINNGGQFVLQGTPTVNSGLAITLDAGGLMDVSGLSSPFTLGAGASLSGNGSVAGSVTAASGSLIVPGAAGTAGTLTFGSDLTLNGQAFTFDLSNDTTEGGGTNDEIVVGGNLTLNGGEKIYLNYLDGQLAPGTYKLIAYGLSKSGNFTLAASYPNVTLDNTGTPGYVTLVVSAPSVASDLTWKGDGTANVWDLNNTANWITNWASPATVYSDPSKVTFDDNGSNSPAINLNATVLPSLVTFNNNTKAYTISGTGKISGATSMILAGDNTVTLTTENDFSGGASFTAAGTLQLGNGGTSGAVGSGTINLGSASPTVIVNRTTPLTLGTLAGSAGAPQIEQNGSGTTTLGGTTDNSNLGAVVNNGTLVLGKASGGSVHALNSALTVNPGGTLKLGGAGGNQINDSLTTKMNGGTFDLAGQTEAFTTLLPVAGSCTITDSVGSATLTLNGRPGLQVGNATATPMVTLWNGTLNLANRAGFDVYYGTLNMRGGAINCTGSADPHNGVEDNGVFNMYGGTMGGNGNYYFSVGSQGEVDPNPVTRANFYGGTFSCGGEFIAAYHTAATISVNPGATLNLNYWSYGEHDSTNYLNGGQVNAYRFKARGGAGSTLFYFNGATILDTGGYNPYIADMTHAYISTNGVILNDNGYSATIQQALEHDPALGAARDGGFTKMGGGSVTLSAVNSFTGGITNMAGALQLMTTQGAASGDMFVDDNATNIILVAARGTTSTNQSLTLGTTGTGTQGLDFNLQTLGLPTAPPLDLVGTLASAGNVAVGIIAPIVPPGQAALIKYGSFDPSLFANWSVAPMPYVGLSLSNNTANSSIDLVVAPGNYPTWTAAANHTWDTTSIDWKMSLSGTPTNYFETTPPGPPVNFDDTATGANSHDVQLTAQNVSPAFITVSNSLDYLFEGPYGIQGAGALLKHGAGALILSNGPSANTYSGETFVTGGSLVAGVPNALSGASDTTLSGSVLDIGTNAQSFGNLTLTESQLLGTGTLTGNGTLAISNSATDVTISAPLAGAIYLVKDGPGMLSLTTPNTFTGISDIHAGTLRLTDGQGMGPAPNYSHVSPGAAVMMDGSLNCPESFVMGGAGPTGLGCLIITNGNTTIGAGGVVVQLATDSTIYVAGNSKLTSVGLLTGARLIKLGTGMLVANTPISDNVTVSQGTLLGAAQIGHANVSDISVIVNAGATFGGIGPVTPVADLEAGSTCTPGVLGFGTLTFNNSVTNAANCLMEIGKSGATLSHDEIVANSNFVFTGTVTLTNLGPDALAAGDSFKLFSLSDYSALAGVTPTLPTLPTGLLWTNKLAVDGSMAVYATVSTTPTNITWAFSGGNLTLQWPSDHLGWRLLVQTNHLEGISTNPADWGTYPNSTNVNQVIITVDPAKPTEFYRLVYP